MEKMTPPITALRPRLKTPVLLIVFNRLDTTKQVLDAIREAKAPRLYIAADGPRGHVTGEDSKVRAVREYVLSHIDWDCEVKTLFRENNLGCKYAVSGAINWFFENEEMGIILEDDCLPSQSFFFFCSELLERYKNDVRIWQISGANLLENRIKLSTSYIFSRYGGIWGWATWARHWHKYDIHMISWPEKKMDQRWLRSVTETEVEINIRKKRFDNVYYQNFNTWDYQWIYTKLLANGLSIIPRRNLVKNIGFGADATHTATLNHVMGLERKEMEAVLIHPDHVGCNPSYENLYSRTYFVENTAYCRILRKVRRTINDLFFRPFSAGCN